MKRIGKYTGTIYDDDYDFSKCPECCTVISDDEANNEDYVKSIKNRNKLSCLMCVSANTPCKPCPASNNPLI